MDWLDLLAVQGTLKSLLQLCSSKASIQLIQYVGFPGGSVVKTLSANAGEVGSTQVRKIPWRRESQPKLKYTQFSSVAQSYPTLRPHGLQHARLPYPSPTPGVHPNPCPLSRWCHPTISSSVIPFSSCLQSFPASGSFLMSQLFPSGGQSIGTSV